MNTGTDRRVVVALLTVVAVGLLGLGIQLYRAKAAELHRLQQDLAKKEKERDDVKAKVARMPELEAKFAELQQRLAILEPTLPNSAYIPTFLRQIENLAVSTGNQIVAIRPQKRTNEAGRTKATRVNEETGEVISGEKEAGSKEATKKGTDADKTPKLPYGFVGIELKIEGTYWSQIEFLKRLQQFPKMIAVNNVGFAPRMSGRDPGAMSSQELVASMDLTAVVSETKGDKDGKAS